MRASPGTPFCARGHLECVESADLRCVEGDDQLAALLVRQPAGVAELTDQFAATGAQLGLEAAGLVVDPGVHDARVVPCLVGGEVAFLLEDLHAASPESVG